MDDPTTFSTHDTRHHAVYDAMSVAIMRGELLRRLIERDQFDAAALRTAVDLLQAALRTVAASVVGLDLPGVREKSRTVASDLDAPVEPKTIDA